MGDFFFKFSGFLTVSELYQWYIDMIKTPLGVKNTFPKHID
jgi:hypothetical protein